MSQKTGKILGIEIDSTSKQRVLRQVQNLVAKGNKFYIVTPNPEIVLYAQTDKDLKTALNNAHISLADGIGLVAAYKFIKLPNQKDPLKRLLTLFVQGLGVGFSILFDREWVSSELKQIKGRDLFMDLIKIANKRKWRVFLLGGEGLEAKKAAESLSKSYKGIKFEYFSGPMLDEELAPLSKQDAKKEKLAVEKINKFKPHLLFVAMLYPRQEKWIATRLSELKVNCAMTVGGAFNYVSKRSKLPPEWMSNSGLEWLWRLINEPKRAGRIFRALFEFPLEVFSVKYNNR